jgi:DNA-binding FadR family transcriptional regulator
MSLGVSFGPFQESASDAHREIVDAIAARNPAAARDRMEAHLDCGSRLMKDALMRGQLAGVAMT